MSQDQTPTSPKQSGRRWNGRLALAGVAVLFVVAVATVVPGVFAQGHMFGGMHGGMRGEGPGGHGHGRDGRGHDEVTMPGLRGLDASEQESAELAEMFRRFPEIDREVTHLPNGIRTRTYSSDEALMATVASHVTSMITRVEEGRDPKIFIQSPTLDILFERRDRITTEIETTDAGIIVTQTSDDPELVAALQIHAGEVSAMVDRGMAAVHEMMMNR